MNEFTHIGLDVHKDTIAVARELSGFVWGAMTGNMGA